MPLCKSKSKKCISKNIKEKIKSGKPRKQEISIELNVSRKKKGKRK